MGWCVGPSSPSPIASWVKTNSVGSSMSADSRMRRARVVAEDEERRPERAQLGERQPLTIAAIACSRMPKCRLRPPGVPASKSPAPSNLSVVLLDGPRSAGAARGTSGMFCASTFSTCPDASRPATPLASAVNIGRSRSQSAGSSRRCICVDLVGEVRDTARGSPRTAHPSAVRASRRGRRCRRRNARCTPSGTRNCASSGQP